MTPLQGMELINPDLLNRQVKEASGKESYFSNKSGFSTVLNLKNASSGGASKMMGPPAAVNPQMRYGGSSNMIL
jgi:hypothetical protein